MKSHGMSYELLPLPAEYRPKVHRIMVKQYGLRKVVRVATHKNGGTK